MDAARNFLENAGCSTGEWKPRDGGRRRRPGPRRSGPWRGESGVAHNLPTKLLVTQELLGCTSRKESSARFRTSIRGPSSTSSAATNGCRDRPSRAASGSTRTGRGFWARSARPLADRLHGGCVRRGGVPGFRRRSFGLKRRAGLDGQRLARGGPASPLPSTISAAPTRPTATPGHPTSGPAHSWLAADPAWQGQPVFRALS